MLLLPDEILRYPLDQGLLIIRGQKVCRFRKMDYLEHPDSKYLTLEKVEAHIPDWYRKSQEEKEQFQVFEERRRKESGETGELAENEIAEGILPSREVSLQGNIRGDVRAAESEFSGLKDISEEDFEEHAEGRTFKEPEPPLAVDTPVKKRDRGKPAEKKREGARITKVEDLFADPVSGRKEEL